jgi:outer membrane protein assembly factor BamB
VQNDRVVFTAPDEASIHCLNLRDGSLAWKSGHGREDLLMAGVFAGKVLVVGHRSCRALALDDGRQLWQLETGLVTGQGTGQGNVYYLPVKEAGDDREPAICTIDLERGTVLSYTPVAGKERPGNLFLWNGELYSQSATALTAYTRRKEKPKEEKPKDDKEKTDKDGSP